MTFILSTIWFGRSWFVFGFSHPTHIGFDPETQLAIQKSSEAVAFLKTIEQAPTAAA
jgi:hypothetical protein